MERVSRPELRDIVAAHGAAISSHDQDEMAIPSYLHANPLIRWLMWRRYARIAELAELAAGETVCEFGCGTGLFLPELSRRVAHVYAIDLFPQIARGLVARRGLTVQFAARMDDLPVASLDAIIAADVLEHITDLRPYLELFASRLKTSGRLIVSGPTENLVYRLGRILAGFAGKGHYHHTDITHLAQAIEAFGFEPIRTASLPFSVPPHLFRIAVFRAPAQVPRHV